MTIDLQRMDKHSLDKMLSSTKEKFECYTSLKKSYEETNEVYLLLKKLQDEVNSRNTGRFGF